jgi:hypothetical protein
MAWSLLQQSRGKTNKGDMPDPRERVVNRILRSLRGVKQDSSVKVVNRVQVVVSVRPERKEMKRGGEPTIVSLSAPYLLSGRKDSFDLNLPALGAPFALWGGEVSHGVLME